MDQPDSCTHCGANLGPADLDKPACPYCGTAHPHIAKARQQVEALRQVFAMGGMPGMLPPPAVAPSPWPQHGEPGQSPAPPLANFGLVAPPPPRRGTSASIVIALVMVVLSVLVALLMIS